MMGLQDSQTTHAYNNWWASRVYFGSTPTRANEDSTFAMTKTPITDWQCRLVSQISNSFTLQFPCPGTDDSLKLSWQPPKNMTSQHDHIQYWWNPFPLYPMNNIDQTWTRLTTKDFGTTYVMQALERTWRQRHRSWRIVGALDQQQVVSVIETPNHNAIALFLSAISTIPNYRTELLHKYIYNNVHYFPAYPITKSLRGIKPLIRFLLLRRLLTLVQPDEVALITEKLQSQLQYWCFYYKYFLIITLIYFKSYIPQKLEFNLFIVFTMTYLWNIMNDMFTILQ